MALQLFANIDRNKMISGLVVSATNLTERPAPQLVAGDKVSFDIFLTSKSGILDIQTYSIQRLALGALNATPTGGTYKIDYGGGSDSTLNFDATAQAFADAINANAPTVPSPVTGTQVAPFTYIIDFGANGTCALPTIESSLTPSSSVSVQRLITGDSSTKEKWLVRLYQDPIALVDTWTNIEPTTGQKGIRGALNLGTEGIFDLLDSNTSASTTMELELTDSAGNLQTIFQSPVTVFSQVIGEAIAGVIPAPQGIPTTATTFLNSFPSPTFAGDVTIEGSILGEADFDGEVTFQDSVTFQGDITGIDTSDVSGLSDALALKADLSSPTFTGTSTFSKITTGEIQCLTTGPLPADASPIHYDATEHRFRDYDEDPQNLMVIKKLNGKNGARVGVNIPVGQNPKCAFHVNYGGSSDGLPREALRVTGGAMFNEWVRIGHFTDAERDALTTPTNGTIIYNDEHHEFQAYIGGAQGTASKWQAFTMQNVST